MERETILYEPRGEVVIITMNRPESLNALNEQLHHDLGDAWEAFKEDDSLRVAIVTGAGRAFCAGADLKERAMYARQGRQPPRAERRDWRKFGLPGPHEIAKPVIAAVNGICVGGGHGIALDCDIRIASTAARFGDLEIRAGQVGRIDLLVKAYPPAVASYLGLTGEMIPAELAHRWGFVSHLVEPDELLETALEIAEKILRNPPRAVEVYKDVALHALRYGEARDYLHHAAKSVLASSDYREAVTSFAEGREASFTGD